MLELLGILGPCVLQFMCADVKPPSVPYVHVHGVDATLSKTDAIGNMVDAMSEETKESGRFMLTSGTVLILVGRLAPMVFVKIYYRAC